MAGRRDRLPHVRPRHGEAPPDARRRRQVQILLGEEKGLLTLKEGTTITRDALSEAVMNDSGIKTHKVEFGGGADVAMQVEGMGCPMCARTLEKRLSAP